MPSLCKHILLPAILPLALIGLYFMPASVLGCRSRGYLALAITAPALCTALATAVKGLLLKYRRHPQADWWVATTLILLLPAVLLLGPLG